MPKRTIELRASMNAAGYTVTLIINGREFTGRCTGGRKKEDVFADIDSGVKDVYGVDMYEDENIEAYEDICMVVGAAEDIIEAMHGVLIFQRGEAS